MLDNLPQLFTVPSWFLIYTGTLSMSDWISWNQDKYIKKTVDIMFYPGDVYIFIILILSFT